MKGIILAGGTGSRLFPATKVLNKHIIPLFDKPMIYYPLSVIMLSGIRDIIIVCNPDDYECYYKLFGNGGSLGICVNYVIQNEPKGIVEGVLLCKDYIIKESVMMILGDNFFYGQSFASILRKAVQNNRGATMFSLFRNYDYVISTIKYNKEKPVSLKRKNGPINDFIAPGLFVYNTDLYNIITDLKPIAGTTEWISVNSKYLSRGDLDIIHLDDDMLWFDVGTPNARLEAEIMISRIQQHQGIYVGCIEEIAYRQNWIDREGFLSIISNITFITFKIYKINYTKCNTKNIYE